MSTLLFAHYSRWHSVSFCSVTFLLSRLLSKFWYLLPPHEDSEHRKRNAHARDNEKSYDFCDANIKNSHSSLSKNISQGFISFLDGNGAGADEKRSEFLLLNVLTPKNLFRKTRQLFLVPAAMSSRYRQSGLVDAVTKHYAKCESVLDA
jgi:hypothetical protein